MLPEVHEPKEVLGHLLPDALELGDEEVPPFRPVFRLEPGDGHVLGEGLGEPVFRQEIGRHPHPPPEVSELMGEDEPQEPGEDPLGGEIQPVEIPAREEDDPVGGEARPLAVGMDDEEEPSQGGLPEALPVPIQDLQGPGGQGPEFPLVARQVPALHGDPLPLDQEPPYLPLRGEVKRERPHRPIPAHLVYRHFALFPFLHLIAGEGGDPVAG